MNTQSIADKYGLTEEWIEQSSQAYERGDWEGHVGDVHVGSHLDVVGKKRVTVVYDAKDAQRVKEIAKQRGVTPSDVYRDALESYLARQTA